MDGLIHAVEEFIFGHVPTAEERRADVKRRLDETHKGARRALIANEMKRKTSLKQQKVHGQRQDYDALRRELCKSAHLNREQNRLQSRQIQIERWITTTSEIEADDTLMACILETLQLSIAQPRPQMAQVAHTLQHFEYQRNQQKDVSQMMREMIDEATEQLEEDETGLNSEEEREIEEQIECQMNLANRAEFDRLPKPLGMHVSYSLMDGPEAKLKRDNREAKKQLDAFIAQHAVQSGQ